MIERRELTCEESTLTCQVCGQEGFRNLSLHVSNVHADIGCQRYKETLGPLVVPGYMRQLAALSNERWADPAVRAARTEGVKRSYLNPLLIESRKEDARAQWKSPTLRRRKIEGLKLSLALRTIEQKEIVSERGRLARLGPFGKLREELYKRAEGKCEICGQSEEQHLRMRGRHLHLHHLNYERMLPELEDVMLLCGPCHIEWHNARRDQDRIHRVTKKVGELLTALGAQTQHPDFAETPRRFAAYLLEHFVGPGELELALEEYEESVFESDSNDAVIQNGITAHGICPHHLLPIRYSVSVGYIPSGSVIGLSKLSRTARTCLAQPTTQEAATTFLIDTLQRILHTNDVAVLVTGNHMCMQVRGPQLHAAETATSACRGAFRVEGPARAEFLSLAH